MDTTELPREIAKSNLLPLATLKARLGSHKTRFFLLEGRDKEGQKGMEITPFLFFKQSLLQRIKTDFPSYVIFNIMIFMKRLLTPKRPVETIEVNIQLPSYCIFWKPVFQQQGQQNVREHVSIR